MGDWPRPTEVEGLGANLDAAGGYNEAVAVDGAFNFHSGASVMTVVTSLEKKASMV